MSVSVKKSRILRILYPLATDRDIRRGVDCGHMREPPTAHRRPTAPTRRRPPRHTLSPVRSGEQHTALSEDDTSRRKRDFIGTESLMPGTIRGERHRIADRIRFGSRRCMADDPQPHENRRVAQRAQPAYLSANSVYLVRLAIEKAHIRLVPEPPMVEVDVRSQRWSFHTRQRTTSVSCPAHSSGRAK